MRAIAPVPGPVDLDAQVRPREVDLEAVELGVLARVGQTGGARELEERVLELASRAGAAALAEAQGFFEHFELATRRSSHGRSRLFQVEELAVLGLVDDVRELLGVEDLGEVDQRACDGRDRDPVPDGDVAWVEVAARVQDEPVLRVAVAAARSRGSRVHATA